MPVTATRYPVGVRQPLRPCTVRSPSGVSSIHLRRGWRTLCGFTVDADVPSLTFGGMKLCPVCEAKQP